MSTSKKTEERSKELKSLLMAEETNDGDGDGSGGDGNNNGNGLNDALALHQANKAKRDAWKPRKRDIARDFKMARRSHVRRIEELALIDPVGFNELREKEHDVMEKEVVEMYERLQKKYIARQYSEEEADSRAEAVAKSLFEVLTKIINEDFGEVATASAKSRQALQTAANTIGKGGMQVGA
jgi:hypothetical protein